MARYGTTADGAFAMLRRTSMHQNRKVRDLAVDVIDIGELPG
jgi:AmiR/NasT family two-component response regulator